MSETQKHLSHWCRKVKCTHCYDDACECECHLPEEDLPMEGAESANEEDAGMFEDDDEDDDEMVE